MTKFDESTATAQELWDWCMREYESRNPVINKLIDRFYRSIQKNLPSLEQGEKVLEVGCGAGESTRRMVPMMPRGVQYQASEYDARYVECLLRTDLGVPVRQESVYELQRADKEFRLVIMLEVLEHLEDYEKALSELFRVSAKYVLISVPNEPLWRFLNLARGKYISTLGNTPDHINHWSPGGLRKLLGKYGRVLQMSTPLPWIIALAEKRDD